jgi:hypothetical protein
MHLVKKFIAHLPVDAVMNLREEEGREFLEIVFERSLIDKRQQ